MHQCVLGIVLTARDLRAAGVTICHLSLLIERASRVLKGVPGRWRIFAVAGDSSR